MTGAQLAAEVVRLRPGLPIILATGFETTAVATAAEGSATKASRIWRPISVRIGMFWRLGSFELNRPVCAPDRLKLVWTRPVSGFSAS